MKTIKELKRGKYTLIHKTHIDEWGKKDYFDLFDEEKRIYMPFWGKIKAPKNDDIMDTTKDYTDEDYEEMLTEQIEKYVSMQKL